LKTWLHPRIIVISLSSLNSSREIGHVAFTGDIILENTVFNVARLISSFVGAPVVVAATFGFVRTATGIVYNIENIFSLPLFNSLDSRLRSLVKYLDNKRGKTSPNRGADGNCGCGDVVLRGRLCCSERTEAVGAVGAVGYNDAEGCDCVANGIRVVRISSKRL